MLLRQKPRTLAVDQRSTVARFLLRDGNKVGADISPRDLDVVPYVDAKGQTVYALASVTAERSFLRRVPVKLLPLYVRMELALARAVAIND